nr:uncharacterized protein LOC111753684 [Cavia porcellus]
MEEGGLRSANRRARRRHTAGGQSRTGAARNRKRAGELSLPPLALAASTLEETRAGGRRALPESAGHPRGGPPGEGGSRKPGLAPRGRRAARPASTATCKASSAPSSGPDSARAAGSPSCAGCTTRASGKLRGAGRGGAGRRHVARPPHVTRPRARLCPSGWARAAPGPRRPTPDRRESPRVWRRLRELTPLSPGAGEARPLRSASRARKGPGSLPGNQGGKRAAPGAEAAEETLCFTCLPLTHSHPSAWTPSACRGRRRWPPSQGKKEGCEARGASNGRQKCRGSGLSTLDRARRASGSARFCKW